MNRQSKAQQISLALGQNFSEQLNGGPKDQFNQNDFPLIFRLPLYLICMYRMSLSLSPTNVFVKNNLQINIFKIGLSASIYILVVHATVLCFYALRLQQTVQVSSRTKCHYFYCILSIFVFSIGSVGTEG